MKKEELVKSERKKKKPLSPNGRNNSPHAYKAVKKAPKKANGPRRA